MTNESCIEKANIPQRPPPKNLTISSGVLGVQITPDTKIVAIRKKAKTKGSGRYFCTRSLQKFVSLFITLCYPISKKLEHLLLELAAEKNPLALQFYNASHQRMCNVWHDFLKEAITLNFIQNDDIENQTNLILSLLLGVRHHEVLLGIRPIPTTEEKQHIIKESIDLFMLKYKAT